MNEDLFRDLSYRLVGFAIDLHNELGQFHKEVIYQRALEEKLAIAEIPYISQAKIPVISKTSGKQLGWYQPDLLIDQKIIVEIKATEYPIQKHELQLKDYLKNSKIELGYLLNFGGSRLHFRRIIFTNGRK